MSRRILVAAGGGSFGAYEAGVLDYLVRTRRFDYSEMFGVSVGAIITSFLAQYGPGELDSGVAALLKWWKELRRKDVYCKPVEGVVASVIRQSMYDSTPIVKRILRELDMDRVDGSGRRVSVGAVCWDTGEYRMVNSTHPRFPYWVLASSSYPNFFLPVIIDGQQWSDGGMRNVTPIKAAMRRAVATGIKHIDVIMTEDPSTIEPWAPKRQKVIPGYLFRSLSILVKELALTDLQVCGIDNDMVELKDPYRDIEITVYRPNRPLYGTSLDFAPANILLNMKRGYEDAERIAPKR